MYLFKHVVINKKTIVLLALILVTIFSYSDAQLLNPRNQTLSGLTDVYKAALSETGTFFKNAAMALFGSLALIGVILRFLPQVTSGDANAGTFFLELVKITLVFGIFYGLLKDGSPIEITKLGEILLEKSPSALAKGYGVAGGLTPSSYPDMGFLILEIILSKASWSEPIMTATSFVLGVFIIILMTVIGIKFLLLKVTGWITLYAGILYVGFAGLDMTRDIAISYIKHVIALMFQIFTFLLIAVVGKNVIIQTLMSVQGNLDLTGLAMLVMMSVAMWLMVDSVPEKVASIVTNSSISSSLAGAKGVTGAAVTAGAASASAGAGVRGGYRAGAGIVAGAKAGFGGAGATVDDSKYSKPNSAGDATAKVPTSFAAGAAIGKGLGNIARRATGRGAGTLPPSASGENL